jgi:hypothetical protein
MKSFKQYVELREQAKPIMPGPPMSGTLRTARNRFTQVWDKTKDQNPDAFRDKFLNSRRVRSGIGQNLQDLTGLVQNNQELGRLRNNALYTMNRVFGAERKRLSNQS